ncbi:hypothetical protein [Streptomyces sp. KLOTTS4A1]|uniref:hypothetical protein n=1 Tax=Streptomyces sp. KLOTTS4A1 TaxID=3390996 RepID=UPI0039F51F7F
MQQDEPQNEPGDEPQGEAPDEPQDPPAAASQPKPPDSRAEPQPEPPDEPRETDAERRRRRARFLRELPQALDFARAGGTPFEAKELRDRVQPRRARAARMRQAMRMRTFHW